jgi:hypothetical protein
MEMISGEFKSENLCGHRVVISGEFNSQKMWTNPGEGVMWLLE